MNGIHTYAKLAPADSLPTGEFQQGTNKPSFQKTMTSRNGKKYLGNRRIKKTSQFELLPHYYGIMIVRPMITKLVEHAWTEREKTIWKI
jgi:hypothetical protein